MAIALLPDIRPCLCLEVRFALEVAIDLIATFKTGTQMLAMNIMLLYYNVLCGYTLPMLKLVDVLFRNDLQVRGKDVMFS